MGLSGGVSTTSIRYEEDDLTKRSLRLKFVPPDLADRRTGQKHVCTISYAVNAVIAVLKCIFLRRASAGIACQEN